MSTLQTLQDDKCCGVWSGIVHDAARIERTTDSKEYTARLHSGSLQCGSTASLRWRIIKHVGWFAVTSCTSTSKFGCRRIADFSAQDGTFENLRSICLWTTLQSNLPMSTCWTHQSNDTHMLMSDSDMTIVS